MTDKAEMPDVMYVSAWTDEWGYSGSARDNGDTAYIRADLHEEQAAEIELLKRVAREVALQHHNWNQHNASLIGEQAAEIERMRAHIQAGRELVPRFQFLFPTSGSKESVGTMVDVLAHMRAQAFLGSAPASGH